MVYLEEMNIIYRDLAARNLLVNDAGEVKVVVEGALPIRVFSIVACKFSLGVHLNLLDLRDLAPKAMFGE